MFRHQNFENRTKIEGVKCEKMRFVRLWRIRLLRAMLTMSFFLAWVACLAWGTNLGLTLSPLLSTSGPGW